MYEGWAYLVESNGQPGPDYWTNFAGRLASLAAPAPGAAVLDIGTDDGNVLFKALASTGNGTGIGIDIDPRGFQHGIRQARSKGWLKRVAFAQMDANALGLAAERFDCILANFVGWDEAFDFESMQYIRPEKITREIWRVLKPGGRVGIGTWIEQSDIDWINNKFREYTPQNRTEGEWATCYARANAAGYVLMLEQSDFINIRVFEEKVSFASPDPETWWLQMRRAARDNFEMVADAQTLETFKEQVLIDLQQHQRADGVGFTKTVAFIFGTKPG